MTRTDKEQLAERLTKEAADKGKLIEVGWTALRVLVIPPNASEIQLREMRMAFMAGAQHLFATVLSILEPGTEPTEADMKRLDLIQKELDDFAQEMKLRASPKG